MLFCWRRDSLTTTASSACAHSDASLCVYRPRGRGCVPDGSSVARRHLLTNGQIRSARYRPLFENRAHKHHTLPASSTYFEPGSELLCDYSLTLERLLTGRALLPKMEQTLTGLMCELVWCFAAELKAKRCIHTVDGVKFIDEVTA